MDALQTRGGGEESNETADHDYKHGLKLKLFSSKPQKGVKIPHEVNCIHIPLENDDIHHSEHQPRPYVSVPHRQAVAQAQLNLQP